MPFGGRGIVGGGIGLGEAVLGSLVHLGAVRDPGGGQCLVESGDMFRSHMVVRTCMREIQLRGHISDRQMRAVRGVGDERSTVESGHRRDPVGEHGGNQYREPRTHAVTGDAHLPRGDLRRCRQPIEIGGGIGSQAVRRELADHREDPLEDLRPLDRIDEVRQFDHRRTAVPVIGVRNQDRVAAGGDTIGQRPQTGAQAETVLDHQHSRMGSIVVGVGDIRVGDTIGCAHVDLHSMYCNHR